MEDRIGDLLAERAALDSGAAPGIVLSILLHAGITAIAVYAALHHPPPQEVNMLTIKLAPMTPANAAPARPVARPAPVSKTLTEPRPVVEQPKPAPVVAKPSKQTAPTSPFGKSAKKGADVPAPPPPAVSPHAAGSASTAGVADVPVGTAGVTGIEGDFPYSLYIERMKQLIGTHWFRPQITRGTATTIYYEIERDGTIRNAKIETAGGNGTADRAALRAVIEASPLPPLPFAYNGAFLGVHLTFK
jgi:TonB family protein